MVQVDNNQIWFGGIEAGGTKFNCVVANQHAEIQASATFMTDVPDNTLVQVTQFFANEQKKRGPLSALGIASFGPIELDTGAPYYGHILSTPKASWSYTNLVGFFSDALGVPIAIETDVNGSALGEAAYGAARGLDNFVYVTVGTGIGAGVISHGQLVRGAHHPELGHMLIPQDKHDSFAGCCPFHGNCLEGLASGPAMKQRWNSAADVLSDGHAAWKLEAHYLALMCVNITNLYAPQRIILGGGVMNRAALFPLIRTGFLNLMNGYGPDQILQKPHEYIVPPGIAGGKSGVMGSLLLAKSAFEPTGTPLRL